MTRTGRPLARRLGLGAVEGITRLTAAAGGPGRGKDEDSDVDRTEHPAGPAADGQRGRLRCGARRVPRHRQDDWVASTPEAIQPYEDTFPVTDDDRFTPGAVVFPESTEQVREIVRVANRYLIPLHAVSTGKNLGYGGSAPRTRGTVLLHLGTRMNRILEVNDRYGYALLEPGVTYTALYEHIKEHGYNLMIDAPDLAWGSVIGNTMDRGVGYTPYGNHSMWKTGLEVVLPDGDLLRTGLGGLPGANTWQLFAPSFGPSPDNLFEQSNFGIVTKMGIQLM